MRGILAASAALLALAAGPGVVPAWAADTNPKPNWSVIVMTADVARPAPVTWERIGGHDYCAIAKFLAIKSCSKVSGGDAVGALRMINGTIPELLVSRTPLSYTYAQPASPIFYHGTMAVEPVDAHHSRIVYTLLYDQAPLGTDAAMAANREQRRSRFQAAVDKMKTAAEAAP